ncbi:hypothetical protein RCL1_009012 [Eukaryota sp. TZLM3-RCL]
MFDLFTSNEFDEVVTSLLHLHSSRRLCSSEILKGYPSPSSLSRYTSIKLLVELVKKLVLPPRLSVASVHVLDSLVADFAFGAKDLKSLVIASLLIVIKRMRVGCQELSFQDVVSAARGCFSVYDFLYIHSVVAATTNQVFEFPLLTAVDLLTTGVSIFNHGQTAAYYVQHYNGDNETFPKRSCYSELQEFALTILESCLHEEFLIENSAIHSAAAILKVTTTVGVYQLYQVGFCHGISLLFGLNQIPTCPINQIENLLKDFPLNLDMC